MWPHLEDEFGNPSGMYGLGKEAARAIERARSSVADALGCRAQEVVFTGPGTESINAAIKGVAFAEQFAGLGNHVVTSRIEHHAVLHSCDYLAKFGFETTFVPVDRFGMVDPDVVAEAITDRTVLVSVMLANNEVGTVEPLADITEAVQRRAKSFRRRIALHTDAVQSANSLELDVKRLGVDLLSLSAHKFGGPKGAGVLYIRRGTPFLEQLSGGGQERQRRAGTEDVAGIVGTAAALCEAQANHEHYSKTCRQLSRQLAEGVLQSVPAAKLSGHPEQRLPNNVHFEALDELGIAASAGSACTSAMWEPSHVLTAMGMPLSRAAGVLRLTCGPENTAEEIDQVLSILPRVVSESRAKARSGLSAK